MRDLEWQDKALMAAFRQGLKPEVRQKLIEFSVTQNIITLDQLISTACLIDNTLFEACCASGTTSTEVVETPQELGKA